MAEPFFDIGFTGTESVTAKLKKIENLGSNMEFNQAILDSTIIIEAEAKNQLEKMVYSKPQRYTGYRRKKGAGLYGSTQATGEIKKEGGSIISGVVSSIAHAVHVHFGTGIYAENGKGRQASWFWKDEDGNFHKTVGQEPKPYFTEAAKQAEEKVMKRLSKFL